VVLLPWIGVVCGVLVIAGVAKARSPASARDALSAVGLTVPAPVIRGLGVAEIAAGGGAAVWPTAATCALVAALYAGFTLFVLVSMRAPRGAPCGCFGAAETEVGLLHLALNVIACAIGVAAAIAPPRGIGWMLGRAPLTAAPLALGLAAATFAAYLAFTALPGAWRAYGSGRP
jgi:hypothetical protein